MLAGEVNYNKIITKKLASATAFHQVRKGELKREGEREVSVRKRKRDRKKRKRRRKKNSLFLPQKKTEKTLKTL
jgi:hypothetical protein